MSGRPPSFPPARTARRERPGPAQTETGGGPEVELDAEAEAEEADERADVEQGEAGEPAHSGGGLERGVRAHGAPRVTSGLTDRLAERERARRRLRIRGLIAGAVAVLVLVGGGYVALVSQVLALRTEEITVTGTNEIATDEEVLAAVEPLAGEPLLRIDTPALRESLLAINGVLDAAISREFPHGLVITIVPREPVATVADGDELVLLDAEGVELDRSDEPHEGVPQVQVPVGTEQTADSLTAVLTVLGTLPTDLREQVSEASARTPYEVELVLSSGATVVWGSADDSELKAEVLATLLQVDANVYDVSAPLSPITH